MANNEQTMKLYSRIVQFAVSHRTPVVAALCLLVIILFIIMFNFFRSEKPKAIQSVMFNQGFLTSMVGQEISIKGVAEDTKAGAVIVGTDGSRVRIKDMDYWEQNIFPLGSMVSARGVLRATEHPPITTSPDGLTPQGMGGNEFILESIRGIKALSELPQYNTTELFSLTYRAYSAIPYPEQNALIAVIRYLTEHSIKSEEYYVEFSTDPSPIVIMTIYHRDIIEETGPGVGHLKPEYQDFLGEPDPKGRSLEFQYDSTKEEIIGVYHLR